MHGGFKNKDKKQTVIFHPESFTKQKKTHGQPEIRNNMKTEHHFLECSLNFKGWSKIQHQKNILLRVGSVAKFRAAIQANEEQKQKIAKLETTVEQLQTENAELSNQVGQLQEGSFEEIMTNLRKENKELQVSNEKLKKMMKTNMEALMQGL